MTFFVKRTVAGSFTVNDLGVTIPNGVERDLSLSFDVQTIQQSADLLAAINSSALLRTEYAGGPTIPAAQAFDNASIDAHAALPYAHHPHTNKTVIDAITNAGSGQIITSAERSKLTGIAAGAEVNDTAAQIVTKLNTLAQPIGLNVSQVGSATAAQLRDRSTHTGTQLASTVSDFSTAADARITAQKGVASGLATLDGTTKVPIAQVPTGGTPSNVGSGNSAGSASTVALADHVHAHGAQTDGTMHAGATVSVAGFLSASDKSKLDGIASGAQVNDTAAQLVTKLNTLAQPISLNVTLHNSLTSAQVLDRANHTGTQLASTVSDFSTAADARITLQKAAANGLATLDAGGKIPSAQIPAVALPTVSVVLAYQTTPPGSPAVNDKYIVQPTGTGAWAGQNNTLATWGGASWTFTALQEGDEAIETTGSNRQLIFDGTIWRVRPSATGDVVGPGSATADAIALFNGTSGKIIKDSAVLLASLTVSSRNLTAGAGLTGGGTLAADRTFDVVANADGSIVVNANDIQVGVLATDAQHGTRGNGSLHAIATGSVAGFMSAADRTKLDTVATNATNTPLSSTTPADVGNSAIGVGTTAAKADHVHGHGNLAGGAFHAAVTTSVNGFMIAADKTKLDALPSTAPPTSRQVIAGAGLTGGGDFTADRTLDVVAANGSIVVNAGSIQVGVLTADSEHGTRGGGTLHANAVAAGASGFMTGADKTKVDGVEAGAQVSKFRQSVFSDVSADTTTTSTSMVDLLTVNITAAASGILLIQSSGAFSNNTANQHVYTQITVDGVIQRSGSGGRAVAANQPFATANVLRVPVSAGARVVKLRWRVTGGTGNCRPVGQTTEHASLLVSEVSA